MLLILRIYETHEYKALKLMVRIVTTVLSRVCGCCDHAEGYDRVLEASQPGKCCVTVIVQ
jgi:hypothetical protein